MWFYTVRKVGQSCNSFFCTVRSLVQCATSLKAFWHCLSRAETQTGIIFEEGKPEKKPLSNIYICI